MMHLFQKFLISGAVFFPAFSVFAFNDISINDPQYNVFTHLKEVKIMHGSIDGNLYPESNITRAEALTIALRAGAIKLPMEYSGVTYFKDVDPNAWYAPVITRGVDTKVILNKSER